MFHRNGKSGMMQLMQQQLATRGYPRKVAA